MDAQCSYMGDFFGKPYQVMPAQRSQLCSYIDRITGYEYAGMISLIDPCQRVSENPIIRGSTTGLLCRGWYNNTIVIIMLFIVTKFSILHASRQLLFRFQTSKES